MKTIRRFALGLVIIAVLVVAVGGVQVLPTLLAPLPTPHPAARAAPTLSPAEQAGLVHLAAAFDGTAAMAHVYELCAARYDGRRAGAPGGRQAAETIAARFREYGLEPAGHAGTYFQEFTIDYLDLEATPELVLLDRDGAVRQTFVHHQDFREWVGGHGGGGMAQGELVYLGYGEPVDFSRLDVRGKVVLCQPTDTGLAVERAANSEAVALLSVTSDEHDIRRRGSYARWTPDRSIPTLRISSRAADRLLRAAGRSLESANAVGEPFRTGQTVRVSVPLALPRPVSARNVLGLIPGTDPARASEVLIVSANYDHLGRDPDGTLYPGAIDNASGVAVLLEIARTWREQGFQPRISVLFVAWDAQQAGLSGSTYYVDHPRYPLKQTVAVIQLDSVGGGAGDALAVTPNAHGLHTALIESARALNLRMGLVNDEWDSDHVPFDRAGVPAVMLIWSGAWSVTHVPTDTPDAVRVESLRQAGAITSLALMRLAVGEEW